MGVHVVTVISVLVSHSDGYGVSIVNMDGRLDVSNLGVYVFQDDI